MKLPSSILAAVLAGSAVLASANAADMYSPAAGGFKDGLPYAGINWSGFYLGAHVGGVWVRTQSTTPMPTGVLPVKPAAHTTTMLRCVRRGQLGYNFQIGRFVFGRGRSRLYGLVPHPGAPGFTSADSWASVTAASISPLPAGWDTASIRRCSTPRALRHYGGNVSNYSADVPETLRQAGSAAGRGRRHRVQDRSVVECEG